MDCTTVREELSALMDGELPPDRHAAVEAHLAQCSECLREAHALQQVDTLFHALPMLETPPEFQETIRRITQAAEPDAPIQFERVHRIRMRMGPLLVTAAMLIVVVVAVLPRFASQSKKIHLATTPVADTLSTTGSESVISETGAPAASTPSLENVQEKQIATPAPQAAPVPNALTVSPVDAGETATPESATVSYDINGDGVSEAVKVDPQKGTTGSLSLKDSTPQDENRITTSGAAVKAESKKKASAGAFKSEMLPQVEPTGDATRKAKEAVASVSSRPAEKPSPNRSAGIAVTEDDKQKQDEDGDMKGEKVIANTPLQRYVTPKENERRVIEGVNFDYKEGAWRQEGYKGEKTDALIPESDIWKTLIKEYPKLGAFRQLVPKVVFKIAEKWYCIG